MGSPGHDYAAFYTARGTADEITQTLVTGMAGVRGSTITVSAPNTIIVTRTYRPGWAIGLAVVTSILFLFGLLFLLITRTETLTITIAPEGRRCRISIAGGGAHDVIVGVNAGLRRLSDLRDRAGATAVVKDPAVVEAVQIMGGATGGRPAGPSGAPKSVTATTSATPPSASCAGCSAQLMTDDRFCRTCGAPAPTVALEPTCMGCATPLYPGDAFCTGCGSAVVTA